MAASSLRILANTTRRLLIDSNRANLASFNPPARNFVKNDSGAILPKPGQVRFGLIKVIILSHKQKSKSSRFAVILFLVFAAYSLLVVLLLALLDLTTRRSN